MYCSVKPVKTSQKPVKTGYIVQHLTGYKSCIKVITVPEKPFVYARRLGQETVVVQGEDNFATSNMDEGEWMSELAKCKDMR